MGRNGPPPVALATGCLLLLLGCETISDDQILSLDSTGSLAGQVLLNMDGSGSIRADDPPFPGLPLRAVAEGTRDTVETLETNEQGRFRFRSLPVGTYHVRVDSAGLGDSLVVVAQEAAPLRVQPGSETTTEIAVSFPVVAVGDLRDVERGRRVFVEGVLLNDREDFPGGAVHVRSTDGALRALELREGRMLRGDSTRMLGRVEDRAGHAVLLEASSNLITEVSDPQPTDLLTGDAATADGGDLAADLVRLRNARVISERFEDGRAVVWVSDGSGFVEVDFQARAFDDGGTPGLGALIDVTGLLVPEGGRWRVLPRRQRDVIDS